MQTSGLIASTHSTSLTCGRSSTPSIINERLCYTPTCHSTSYISCGCHLGSGCHMGMDHCGRFSALRGVPFSLLLCRFLLGYRVDGRGVPQRAGSAGVGGLPGLLVNWEVRLKTEIRQPLY